MNSGEPQHQLPLEIRLRDDATLDNFLAFPAVEPLLAAINEQLAPGGEALLYVYGVAGTGKSHLLQASCHAPGKESLYLPLRELQAYPPDEVLQGVEALDRVCLDDLEVVAGDAAWERALFHLCNRARERNCRLVVAAKSAPRGLAVKLPDLQSRLSWGIVYQLPGGGDEEKIAILQFRAAQRGLSLPPAVASYIISRAPRSTEHLLALLEQLDRASLAEQRALSVPFVKAALGW